MQTDQVILVTHRHVGRGKQRAVFVFVQQQVEGFDVQLRVARHVRQVGMDLPKHQNGLPGGAPFGDHRQQVEGHVGVATEAQRARPLVVTRDQLRHQIQAMGVDIAGGVAVIAADVVLLGRRTVEQAARLHEELLDADVGRQLVAAQCGEKFKLRVVTEGAFQKRLEKPRLQTLTGCGASQGQGGVDRQPSLWQLADALVQRVDEPIGLAQPQRHAEMDMLG
ncbi:hypothetical protein ALP29_200310 [Pseudomonas syringae pv. avii]|uniref:Uncharacterized protein n=1 Tax=Pseudomonas syringae pv. avii TaxID=663959 RepID=A0A3M5U6V6_PSESX|nr:hypothetical protein ALP29_200310 [Pseudomonas syringae pv. avii]